MRNSDPAKIFSPREPLVPPPVNLINEQISSKIAWLLVAIRKRETSDNRLFNKSLRFLKGSMQLVGLAFPISHPDWIISWNYIVITLYLLSFIHHLASQVYLISQGDHVEAFYRAFSCFQLLMSLLLIKKFWAKRVLACRLPSILEDCLLQIPNNGSFDVISLSKQITRQVRVNVFAGWVCIAYFICTFVTGTLMEEDLHNYVDSYWFGLNVTLIGRESAIAMSVVETCVYYLETMAPIQFCALYYTFICILMRKSFEAFNTWVTLVAESQCKASAHTLIRVRQLHNKLTKTVELIDTTFSAPVFFMYLITVSDMSKYLYFLMHKVTKGWTTSIEIVFVFCRIGHMLWLFFMMSCSASAVALISNACLEDVHQMTTECHKSLPSERNVHLDFHAMALITKLTNSPSYLTGWNVFYITRSFILTVLGGVLTYTLIVVQLMPS